MTDCRTVHIPVSLSDGNRAATVSLARAPWEPQSSQVTDHSETVPTGRVIRHEQRRGVFEGVTLAHLHERQAEMVRHEKAGLR